MFKEAPKEVQLLGKKLIDEHHSDLRVHDVKIQYVLAYGKRDESGALASPALKLHGIPCNGIAKILSLKDRCLRGFDCEISLDGDQWPKFDEKRKLALLDHELNHFIVSKNSDGEVKFDSNDRPKLEMRPHDYDFGWFTIIARRHGEASFEVEQANMLYSEAGQVYFPFVNAPVLKPGGKLKTIKQ